MEPAAAKWTSATSFTTSGPALSSAISSFVLLLTTWTGFQAGYPAGPLETTWTYEASHDSGNPRIANMPNPSRPKRALLELTSLKGNLAFQPSLFQSVSRPSTSKNQKTRVPRSLGLSNACMSPSCQTMLTRLEPTQI